MDEVNLIKKEYFWKGKSARAVALMLGHSPRTVKKAIGMTDFSEVKLPHTEPRNYVNLKPLIETINTWLQEDVGRHCKQRHTAKRIYDRLRDEKGYTGSYSTVKCYVREKRREMQATRAMVEGGFLPLAHIKGWGQVDFGDFRYYDAEGNEHLGKELIVSFPYSNKAFVQFMPAENLECFIQGLKNIFEYIGGVPIRLLFDNLRIAVKDILDSGQRLLTERFCAFVLHYGFEDAYCAPQKGNQKGSVERKVSYIRSNTTVPYPTITDFKEKNKEMLAWCDKDAQREHYKKERPIEELWQEEVKVLQPLPEKDFPVYHIETLTVDKCGFVTFNGNRYGLPPNLHGQKVPAKVFYDHLEFIHNNVKIAEYPRLYSKNEEIGDWIQYLDTLAAKPGGFKFARFYEMVPDLVKRFVDAAHGDARKKAFLLMIEIVRDGNHELIERSIEMAINAGRLDVDTVRQCYYALAKKGTPPEPMTLKNSLPAINFSPDLAAYDALKGVSGHA